MGIEGGLLQTNINLAVIRQDLPPLISILKIISLFSVRKNQNVDLFHLPPQT